MIRLFFPFAPVSYNNAYKHKRRILSDEAREFKRMVEYVTSTHNIKNLNYNPDKHALAVRYIFRLKKITTKEGRLILRRHDFDGFIKLFQDSMTKRLGVDDSVIIEAHIEKKEGQPSIEANIWTIPLDTIYN
jgi:Holliday junction resolvase RusA-like endonuclease